MSKLAGNARLIAVFVMAVVALLTSGWAQSQLSPPVSSAPAAQALTGEISGTVKAGNVPLPGVTVSASSPGGQKLVTSTDAAGRYVLSVPANGRYVVKAEMAAFAPSTKEAVIGGESRSAIVDLEMQLLSRVQAAQQQRRAQLQQLAGAAAGRGFQNLQATGTDLAAFAAGESGATPGGDGTAANGFGATGAGDANAPPLPGAGVMDNAATESVSIAGQMGQSQNFGSNLDDLRDRIEEMRAQGPGGNPALQVGGGGPGGFGGGRGGFGGGGGSPMMVMIGGPGGGGPGRGGMGFNRFNVNRPHGSLFYNVGDPVFDATPYSLTSAANTKPDYMTNRFGGTVGGPLNIPKIYKGGDKTFFFLNYTGRRDQSPYDFFATVPTLAQRAGDFSGTFVNGAPVQIMNPATHQPFSTNQIPATMIDPAAAGLLKFIPLPNQPDGSAQNFHYNTTGQTSSDGFNIRVMHNFGQTQPRGQRQGGAGQRGPGGRGARGRFGARNNLNIAVNYTRTHNDLRNPFPSITGQSSGYGLNVPIGYVRSFGRLVLNTRVQFNRSRNQSASANAFVTNIAQQLGITGVSQNPLDFGVPRVSLTHYSGLSDINPSLRRDQTWTFSEGLSYNKGKFNWRFGGDFRRIQLNPRSDPNSRGTFLFTGFYSGYDFADFLLGRPQQTSAQYGVNNYYFRGNSWDLFVQNDWKLRGNLTLMLGLRYEYVSPMSEINNRLVNLDADPLFSQKPVPVEPGQTGPFHGTYAPGLVNPDRNNFAPRLGLAWKPLSKTVVRTGYGINYNTGAYQSIVQQMAFQPPFTFTQTNTVPQVSSLTLENGFPAVAPGTITNNFGVNPDYRLGYVQAWNFGVQQELSKTLILNVDYNGAKGTRLDLVRAPNRTATGVKIAGVQPFLWWDSLGDSTSNSLSVRARKRMQHGISIGGNYVWSKSLDNASSIGGSGGAVNHPAQNDQDLQAERGLSSFDVRHRLTADYLYELPFGTNKRWLSGGGAAAKIFGDWTFSGNMGIQSGSPFTATVVGAIADVARGVNGTLRANYTGQPIQLSNWSIGEFFNTAAFVAPPPGQFGNSRRNLITGPGLVNFNMSLSKNIPLREMQGFEVRIDSSNVFNTPHFTAIDTNVNSLTYGRITSVGQMRKITLSARYRF